MSEKLPTEAEVAHAFDQLKPYHGVTNSWGRREALISATKFLRARYASARCDNEAVSCCVNCNTMTLVGTMERLLAAAARPTEDAVERVAPFAKAIGLLEAEWYSDEELARWLTAPQPLIDNKTPIDLLAAGRKAELLNIIQAMDEGAYL